MGFALAPSARQRGYGLEILDAVGSTNAEALEQAAMGVAGPAWFVTDNQTSGRGRRGRAWQDARGNLAATLLLVMPADPARAATLGFVAGVALTEALKAVLPEAATLRTAADGADLASGKGRLVLKWPNDLLLDGGKICGILLESRLERDGNLALAIGIGVNVVSHPEGLPYPATSLRALGAGCTAGDLFLALSDAWIDAYDAWSRPGGLAETRRRWLENAAGTGTPVSVNLGERILRGTFETIDEQCRFVIRTEDGSRETIAAGDVHFGTVATVRSN
jgi:BirA family transcriptional regulator, biotin operon repressor / biotin---[acetyl-CoA-carboxylase] ligase